MTAELWHWALKTSSFRPDVETRSHVSAWDDHNLPVR